MLGLVLAAPLAAQTREITGKVTQAGVGTPITEATIGIVGAQLGVRTNESGEYRLRVPQGDAMILVRAIGFKRQTLRVPAGQATADFALEKDVLQLEGVTVTGQATTVDKRNASTAISSVSAEELLVAPAKSIEGNLSGKVVGASIYENSGTPGGGMQIQIRGATSIMGQGDPLYVVDGVIVSNQSVQGGLSSITRSSGTTASSQDQTVNRLADINPNDIESIEVLKSAAATAIYGSRATNGVVVITTKRGKSGATRYNITQRVGSQQAIRLLGSRHFTSYADGCGPTRSAADPALCKDGAVKPYIGSSAQADSVARANCTASGCPWYDWQGDLYNNTSPSFETVMSASGGFNATKYFGSINDRQVRGTQQNSGARMSSGRLNIDQTIGEKLTLSAGANLTHNTTHNGVGGNDNSGISPMYALGYAPAIYDLQQIDPLTGRPVRMFMNGGGTGTVNPFDALHQILNAEETWRQIGNLRLGYSALSTVKNTVQLTYLAGVDRFSFEGNQYSPNYLQYEAADGFLGTAQINSTTSKNINQSVNAVWTFSPGYKWFNSLQTSVGGTYETQYFRNYAVRQRGLTPTKETANGGSDVLTVDNVTEFRDQSRYINAQFIGLDEKLALSVGVRGDRGSANGDRSTFYTFPKYSASYRFQEPLSFLTSKIDEVKFRASYGQSGNRPNYGVREITIGSGGVIGGSGSLSASQGVGNPNIKPEVMNEFEVGADAAFLRGRALLEVSRYNRVIKDLLVTYPLAPSSGLGNQTVNGGQISTRGIEAGLTLVPISTRNAEWTFRTNYQHNVQYVDKLNVPAFNAPGGSFGVSYGRNRIVQGTRPTYIWGNQIYSCVNSTNASGQLVINTGSDGKPCHRIEAGQEVIAGSITRDSIIADANPIAQISFLNTIRWKSFTVTGLLDWRVAGYTSDMTKNTWDEGGNSRDYDQPSPKAGMSLGDFRYSTWQAGNIGTYIDRGTYLKLREVSVSYQAPKAWASRLRANDLRVSVQGRNLGIKTDYWSFDPEFNNFGNQNFNRFIDLGPYPSMRQFFFSVDLGY